MTKRHRIMDPHGKVLEALRAADDSERDWAHRFIPYETALKVIGEALGIGRRAALHRLLDATMLNHVAIVRVSDGGRRIESRFEDRDGPGGNVTWRPLTMHETRGIVADDGTVHYTNDLPADVRPAAAAAQWVGLVDMIDRTRSHLTERRTR